MAWSDGLTVTRFLRLVRAVAAVFDAIALASGKKALTAATDPVGGIAHV